MCFKLLLSCPQIGNNPWEWSYGKHDEQEFTGLNIVWVGTILDRIFWIAIIWVGIFWVGNFQVGIFLEGVILGVSFPGGSYPGWKFSRWELSWVGIFRVGDILGGNFLWWGFFGWELSGENHPDGNFPGGSFPSTAVFMVRGISLGNGFWVVNTLRAPVRKRIKRSTLNLAHIFLTEYCTRPWPRFIQYWLVQFL